MMKGTTVPVGCGHLSSHRKLGRKESVPGWLNRSARADPCFLFQRTDQGQTHLLATDRRRNRAQDYLDADQSHQHVKAALHCMVLLHCFDTMWIHLFYVLLAGCWDAGMLGCWNEATCNQNLL